MNTTTVVSQANAPYRVKAHVACFKGSVYQLLYKYMEVISWVSPYAGQNYKLCLSAHGRLPRHYGAYHIEVGESTEGCPEDGACLDSLDPHVVCEQHTEYGNALIIIGASH